MWLLQLTKIISKKNLTSEIQLAPKNGALVFLDKFTTDPLVPSKNHVLHHIIDSGCTYKINKFLFWVLSILGVDTKGYLKSALSTQYVMVGD